MRSTGTRRDYLAEWLEFHRLVGFERFYLYNNFSRTSTSRCSSPTSRTAWSCCTIGRTSRRQFEAYDHCLATHGESARWIGFFDIDEFLFSPTYAPVPDVLADYEQWPGVCVNLPRFGTSGHQTKPDGLVIENYLVRLQVLAEQGP